MSLISEKGRNRLARTGAPAARPLAADHGGPGPQELGSAFLGCSLPLPSLPPPRKFGVLADVYKRKVQTAPASPGRFKEYRCGLHTQRFQPPPGTPRVARCGTRLFGDTCAQVTAGPWDQCPLSRQVGSPRKPPGGDAGHGSGGSNFHPLTFWNVCFSQLSCCHSGSQLAKRASLGSSERWSPGKVRRAHTHPLQMFVNVHQGCETFTDQKAPVLTLSLYLHQVY